ncbi:MAG: tRNA pseudouridine(38-40) synthase TruA [Chromatiales bacterium]|jgi:tRNA pseudouridine38-40 synthase
MRIAVGVEYDGYRYRGWQTQQEGVRTIQPEVEKALAFVADHPVRVHCAGRTDAGVHAREQVIHFETLVDRPLKAWVMGGNVQLPDDVNLLWASPVPDHFHARFSARFRSYRYRILNRPVRSALLYGRATWIYRALDAVRMHRAGQALTGTHDFTSYRAIGCQAKQPVRTVTHLEVTRDGDIIELYIRANAFLHHMVRNIAGVLIAIGAGEQPESWAREVLEHRNRTLGGVTAPPDGLYFEHVEYEDEFQLPRTHNGQVFYT